MDATGSSEATPFTRCKVPVGWSPAHQKTINKGPGTSMDQQRIEFVFFPWSS
ncbi:hypothetical protein PT974_03596 [Cladobotryum mycophilum]|uniref:Uncharacterized protein n=1 Tax=Cladobotryum mycophilum TaxID=491253 RepID=A0ABR0SSS0_9HYPO